MEETNFNAMTRPELERELNSVQEELDEINEMRQAVLGQTGIHIGMAVLKQYESRFTRDQKLCEERITQIRMRIAALESEPSQGNEADKLPFLANLRH